METEERRKTPWVRVRFGYLADYEAVQRCVRLLSRGIVMRAKGDPWGAERRSQSSLPFDGDGTMGDGKLMGGRQAQEVGLQGLARQRVRREPRLAGGRGRDG